MTRRKRSDKRRGPGEGSIYLRADGYWYGAVELSRRADGRRQRKTVTGASYEDVRRELTKLVRSRDAGKLQKNERVTVGAYLDRWLEETAAPRIRPSTYCRYRTLIQHHLVPAFGATRLDELRPRAIQTWIGERHKAGAAPKTIRNALAVLGSVYRQAELWGDAPQNVVRLVALPALPEPGGTALTSTELLTLLATARTARFARLHPLVAVAIGTGCRIGELLALKWSEVDYRELRTLVVLASLQQVRGRHLIDRPKTRQSGRAVPLPLLAVQGFVEQAERLAEAQRLQGSRWHDRGLVFPNRTGGIWDPGLVRAQFRALVAAAGVRTIRFHDLRRAYSTLLAEQGVSPKLAQQALGHASVDVTLGVYTSVRSAWQREAAEAIDRALGVQVGRSGAPGDNSGDNGPLNG